MDEEQNDCEEQPNGGDDDTPNCLEELLGKTVEKAKVGEFRKSAEEKLIALNGGVGDEEKAYRDALTKPDGFIKTWEDQDKAICKIQSHLETCHPNWRKCIEDVVCKEVIGRVWRLRKKYLKKLGKPDKKLILVCEDFDAAGAQLEAWTTITAWITKRLADNQALIDRICALDNCTDRLTALYLFYFVLLPAHRMVAERPDGAEPSLAYSDPERYYCGSTCNAPPPSDKELCGFPWLIDPDDYNCKLADVFKIWRACGKAKAIAECNVEQIEVCKTQYEESSTDEAKEDAAIDALRRKDQRNGCEESPTPPPPPQPPQHPTQQVSA